MVGVLMTFKEFLPFLLASFLSIFWGGYVASTHGRTGFLVGAVAGLCLATGITVVWYLLRWIYRRYWSSLPQCKKGLCGRRHYRYVGSSGLGTEYVCACGNRYFKCLNEFRELMPDGSTIPYMIRRGVFRRWETNDSSCPSPSSASNV